MSIPPPSSATGTPVVQPGAAPGGEPPRFLRRKQAGAYLVVREERDLSGVASLI